MLDPLRRGILQMGPNRQFLATRLVPHEHNDPQAAALRLSDQSDEQSPVGTRPSRFALSGTTAGVRRRLDLFGVLVLSFVAGNFGGIARDLMIGAVPPTGI